MPHDPKFDSKPLWLLAAAGGLAGWEGVPDETWVAAKLVCNRLRGMVGTPDEAAQQAVAVPQVQPTAERIAVDLGAGGATVNARLVDLLQKDPDVATLSAQNLADKLGCSRTAVAETETWKKLKAARESARIEQAAKKPKA